MRKRFARLFALALVVCAVLVQAIPVHAATDDVTDIMTTGLASMKTDVFSIIAVALPVGFAIFAAFFGIRKGLALLRGVAK